MRFFRALGRGLARFGLWLLMVLAMVVLLVGGTALFFYQQADEGDLPASGVSFGGTELTVNGYDWTLPVLGGITEKQIARPGDLTVEDLGSFSSRPELTLPADFRQDCTAKLTITDETGATVFDGDAAGYAAFSFVRNGRYQATLRLTWPPLNSKPTGWYDYRFRFTLDLASDIAISTDTVKQGEVIAVGITGLPAGAEATVETDLGPAWFVPRYDKLIAYIPVAYNREDGDYTIHITAGGHSQDFTVKVLYNPFEKVNLETDTLSGRNAAVAQYQQAIWPLFETHGETCMWTGVFQEPVEQPNDGLVLSDYGSFEYIGDRTSPSRNTGITYKCHQGVNVSAPAAGQVVYAGNLELSGGTVVIEHGAGLKSYLYHLSEVSVKEGDTVEAGQLIGKSSTLLQFDMRIGNQSVDPNQALRGIGGLFWR